MTIFRYNESYYFVKGFFNKSIYKGLLNLGVRYDKGFFYIPIDVIEEVCSMLPDINVVNYNLWKHIFIGNIAQKSVLTHLDASGQMIYLLDDENHPELTNIKKIKYFNMNLLKVQQFNISLQKPLYVEDLFYSTEIGLNEYRNLFYSSGKILDLPQMINRVCLPATL